MLLRTVLSEAVLLAVVSRGVTWCSVPAFRGQVVAVYCAQLTAGHRRNPKKKGHPHRVPLLEIALCQRLCCTFVPTWGTVTTGWVVLIHWLWSTPVE